MRKLWLQMKCSDVGAEKMIACGDWKAEVKET